MHVRAQVILQGASGLPEDRFVNVWHFNNAAATLPLAAADIGPALEDFYGTTTMVAAGQSLFPFFSQFVLRPFEIRFYNMADAPIRVPYTVNLIGNAYSSTSGVKDFPEEVAVCMTYHGGLPVTPRTRGRFYLGPLNSDAATDASTALPCRVAPAFRTALATWAGRVVDADVGWSVWSPTASQLTVVQAGFIDDAFDTQRRRGPAPSTRTLFPVP